MLRLVAEYGSAECAIHYGAAARGPAQLRPRRSVPKPNYAFANASVTWRSNRKGREEAEKSGRRTPPRNRRAAGRPRATNLALKRDASVLDKKRSTAVRDRRESRSDELSRSSARRAALTPDPHVATDRRTCRRSLAQRLKERG